MLCDNPECGAILRLSGEASIRVQLKVDELGAYFVCPRCLSRTNVLPDVPDPATVTGLTQRRGSSQH